MRSEEKEIKRVAKGGVGNGLESERSEFAFHWINKQSEPEPERISD